MSAHTVSLVRSRMAGALIFTVLLLVLAYVVQHLSPGSLMAVTLYKAHLMVLGGWGGYWIDRALFPYSRPHEFLHHGAYADDTTFLFATAQLRRVCIIAACLVCVGLGA